MKFNIEQKLNEMVFTVLGLLLILSYQNFSKPYEIKVKPEFGSVNLNSPKIAKRSCFLDAKTFEKRCVRTASRADYKVLESDFN